MKPLKVNPEYQNLVPPPTKEEYGALERDMIEKGGALDPIKINKRDEILDGHTRYKICSEYALHFETVVVDLPTTLDEKIYIIEMNLKRRHLTDYQKVELAKPLELLIAEKARLKQLSTLMQGDKTPILSNDKNEEAVHTDKTVAKMIGVSSATYSRAKKVRDQGTDEEKRKAREKKRAIASAYRDVVKREKRNRLTESGVPPLPEGQFDVIYADPPWEYDVPLRGAPDLHYATMKQSDIIALKVPAAEDAVLFLWATNPKLREA